MNLLSIAQKNIRKNFSFYSLYLFSVSFVFMVFFSFISFAMNEVIMERISTDGRVEMMSKAVAILIMGFVLFYMSYANTFFMKRRMKELEIYSLLGYRKSTMTRLLSFENFFICISALGIGIFFGAFLHKIIIIGIVHLLDLQIDASKIPLINLNAVYVASGFVLVVLFVLFLSNWKFLKKSSLLTLVRLGKKVEQQIKVKIWLAILGVILLILGYVTALDITRGKDSFWVTVGFGPMAMITLISVVLGTIFFIHSFIPYAILKLKKKKEYFYQETNIITIPKFIYRIQSNAKALIILTLLSAATLSILGSAILSIYYPYAGLSRVIPAAIEFHIKSANQVDKVINIVKKTVGGKHIDYKKTSLIQVTSSTDNLPFEYSAKQQHSFDLISKSDYMSLIQLQGKKVSIKNISGNDCTLVKYTYDKKNIDIGKVYSLNIANHKTINVNVVETTLINPIGFANSMGTLVISDELYTKTSKLKLHTNEIMSVFGKNMRNNKEVYEQLAPMFKNNNNFVSSYQKQYEYISANSVSLLLITFATAIFFIATGSILYFHSISGITNDKREFYILKKMGYKNKEIKKIISKQILVFFSIPYLLGVIHSIFALECFVALIPNLLGKSSTFILPILASIGIFTIIYVIYYIITKYSCYRIILNNKE
ncbi:FtsX-like permease family protein [Clostridium estertheticum]|uniref:FtsX-like permease family protein n=1 Tax=Clostridium estertheticum TaxID=238834 RepID=UPI001C0C4A80|nr:FtsX-like permease family protein [Clostridium estertheticum]MBU3174833.1 FtsX-like permease family protein [Clostridium estertheticum]